MRLSRSYLRAMAALAGIAPLLALAGCSAPFARSRDATQVVVVTATPAPATPPPLIQVSSDIEDLYVALYERTSPSVVHINSRTQVWDFFRGVVPQSGSGSGFVYDTAGHIVTNYHVIDGADEIEVIFADDTSVAATVVGADAYNDLAVLKVEGVAADKLRSLPLGRSGALRVGQRVIAIGNPFGLDRTLTTGVISALGRTIESESNSTIGEVIQTDAAINPGNSGGPLLNLRGEVIGVNTSIQSPSGGSVGIGFAVPSDTVQRIVPVLIERGRYEHPTLGFSSYELSADLAAALKLPVSKGLLVAQVQRGGPADQAGVRGATQRLRTSRGDVLIGGDILVAIDDRPITTRDQMNIFLENSKKVGDAVKLSLVRDGQTLTLNATLGAR